MANEFIARKGLVILENGARITGSSAVVGDFTASGDVKATNFRGSGQFLTNIAADSVQYTNVLNKPTLVSSSTQFNTLTDPFTGSFTGSFKGDGSQLTGLATSLRISGSTGNDTVSLISEDLTFSGGNGITTTVTNNTVTINSPSGTVTASSQINHNTTTNYVANQHIDHSTVNISAGSGLSGGGDLTATRTLTLDTGSTHFISGARGTISVSDTAGASGIDLTYNSGTGVLSGTLVNSSVTVNGQAVSLGGSTTVTANTTNALTLGSGLTGTSFNGSSPVTATVDTASAHFITGSVNAMNLRGVFSSSAQLPTGTVSSSTQVNYTQLQNIPVGIVSSSTQVAPLLPTGTVSSSGQVDVRNTTGITTIATTGSNTFTGVQTISNTTNSTAFNNGALIVQGGVGITKDVNISGSVNIAGVLTVASMSTQYVTSSQYNVGVSKIILNDDDSVRFSGLSVIDSGSTYGTGSFLWDSLNNRWIIEADDANYESAVSITGPKHTGTLGDEPGLVDYRIPVAFIDHHIDSRIASSSIRVDFPSRLTHIEAGLQVTGSITSSVGFAGDGSNLTGVVSTLSVTGSQGGTGAVNLKTQGLTITGTNGVGATVSGQTLTISGSNATTSAKGVASFNSTNFTVTGGDVTSNNITINGTGVTLGGTRNITLGQITTQGATTSDQLTLGGGAIIHGVLFTSASAINVAGPVTNQVIATVATGSYDSAQFDYVLKDGTNYRAGTVMAVWNNTTGYEFTDTSTADLGNTGQALLSVDTLSGNVRLRLSLTSGTWTAKTAIRLL